MSGAIQKLKDDLKKGKAQLLDVREEEEWEAGHLKIASLVPLSGLMEGQNPQGFDKNKITYLHCRSGHRVFQAAPLLEELGFREVIPLKEGFDELVRLGFEQA